MCDTKFNLVLIPHIMLWKAQSQSPEVLQFVFSSMQDYITMLCSYVIEF